MPSLSGILRQLPIRDLFSDDVIRDSHRAANLYSRLGSPNYPGLQHQFFANFTINTGAGFAVNSFLGFKIKSFARPIVNMDVVELNQYNKKRLVQTGIKYGPTRVVFYDTNDLVIHQLFTEYCAHYFGDFSPTKTAGSWVPDQVSENYVTDGRGWGFSPKADAPVTQYFFDKIDLYDVAPDGSYTQWQMIHPVVESWALGEDSYEGGTIQKEIVMNFRFEGIAPLVGLGQFGAERLNEQFGLDAFSDHAELPSQLRSLLTDAGSVARDIFGGTIGNIGARFGLPTAIFQAIQTGKIDSILTASNVINVVKGSSSLSSFGNFIFGDSASSSTSSSGSSGIFGLVSSLFKDAGNTNSAESIVSASDATFTNEEVTFFENAVVTDQQLYQSQEGQAATNLATTISGTQPGVINNTGTTLSKNYGNEALVVGPPKAVAGVDTNQYQMAQGIVQTTPRVPDELRDALAGALVSASKKTGVPISSMAKVSTDSNKELALSTTAIGEINKLKPASAQHGVRVTSQININDPDVRRLAAAKRK